MTKRLKWTVLLVAAATSMSGVLTISAPAFATSFAAKYWYAWNTCFGPSIDSGYTACPLFANCSNELLNLTANEWDYRMYLPPYGSTYTGVMQELLVNSTSNQIFDAGQRAAFQWGVNGNYTAFFAMHGASLPVSAPTQPTFYAGMAMYPTGGTSDCTPELLATGRYGNPYLKFLAMWSCDSMNVANDLPAGSDQPTGWLNAANGVHMIAGFSGISHGIGSIPDFFVDQQSQGAPIAWLNHFTSFDGNNSQCAVPTVLGTSANDAWARWDETFDAPYRHSDPVPASFIGAWYYCNCCADYGNNQGIHCTPNC